MVTVLGGPFGLGFAFRGGAFAGIATGGGGGGGFVTGAAVGKSGGDGFGRGGDWGSRRGSGCSFEGEGVVVILCSSTGTVLVSIGRVCGLISFIA